MRPARHRRGKPASRAAKWHARSHTAASAVIKETPQSRRYSTPVAGIRRKRGAKQASRKRTEETRHENAKLRPREEWLESNYSGEARCMRCRCRAAGIER